MTESENRPFEGQALKDILHELARINATAGGLRYSLDPITDEDRKAGAEPLTPEQIQEDLTDIMRVLTGVVVNHLRAKPAEWYAANDEIL
ncbi:hypothetical protein [Acuticoccus sediminis]|uniref:hypothetical protein n=1 Tax=Acuticoccus sediminis TaxID=2184697 RepID=UPI0011B942EE|nr:hypothetical protein [Acuticoccus sediminis]